MLATFPAHATPHPVPAWAWISVLGIAAGAADLAFAAAWWAPQGVDPIRIPQSIAGWVIGSSAARDGGVAAGAFGVSLYLSLAVLMMAAYLALARRLRVLVAHPLSCGAGYGIALYGLLFQALPRVVPLWTDYPRTQAPVAWVVACVVAYVFLFGIPAALAARAHLRAEG